MEENKITDPTSYSRMSTHQTTYIILNGWAYGKSYGNRAYSDVSGMLDTLGANMGGLCNWGDSKCPDQVRGELVRFPISQEGWGT